MCIRDSVVHEGGQLFNTGPVADSFAAASGLALRAHVIFWRGRNFVKDEGDPNYLSLRRDGSRYGGIRDYAETGVARRFPLAPGAVIEVSGRLHRTERHYEYSYRVLSIASLGWKLH